MGTGPINSQAEIHTEKENTYEISGALSDVGINNDFMKELAATMTPGSSTLFILVTKSTPDKVLQELQGTGGRILKTSLSNEDEAKVQAALGAATS
jgi:uncharacterized membrane protein